MATLGLVALPSQIIPMDEIVSSIVLLVGLAVGVDYTLFYLRREREEKAQGRRQARGRPHGRRDLRSCRPRLRLHRHGRDGRHVPRRRPHVHRARHRRDHGRRRRDDRLGHRRARRCSPWLGDRVEKGRVPFLHRLKRADGESRVWNADPDARPQAPGRSRPAWPPRLLVALAIPAFGDAHGADRHRRPAAQARGHEGLRPHAGRLPGRRRSRPSSRSRPSDVTTPADRGRRSSSSRTKAVATGTMNAPARRRRSARTSTSRSINDPDEGRRHRRRVQPGASPRCAAGSSTARSARRRASQHAYVSGMAARDEGLRTPS